MFTERKISRTSSVVSRLWSGHDLLRLEGFPARQILPELYVQYCSPQPTPPDQAKPSSTTAALHRISRKKTHQNALPGYPPHVYTSATGNVVSSESVRTATSSHCHFGNLNLWEKHFDPPVRSVLSPRQWPAVLKASGLIWVGAGRLEPLQAQRLRGMTTKILCRSLLSGPRLTGWRR